MESTPLGSSPLTLLIFLRPPWLAASYLLLSPLSPTVVTSWDEFAIMNQSWIDFSPRERTNQQGEASLPLPRPQSSWLPLQQPSRRPLLVIEHLHPSWRDRPTLSFTQLKGPLETSTIREEGREGSEALSGH